MISSHSVQTTEWVFFLCSWQLKLAVSDTGGHVVEESSDHAAQPCFINEFAVSVFKEVICQQFKLRTTEEGLVLHLRLWPASLCSCC